MLDLGLIGVGTYFNGGFQLIEINKERDYALIKEDDKFIRDYSIQELIELINRKDFEIMDTEIYKVESKYDGFTGYYYTIEDIEEDVWALVGTELSSDVIKNIEIWDKKVEKEEIKDSRSNCMEAEFIRGNKEEVYKDVFVSRVLVGKSQAEKLVY